MHRNITTILAGLLIVAVTAAITFAHCQIPCGIYGDSTRLTLMREHVVTIEKSMKEISRLGKESTPNNNQIARWVMNKESHADELSEIVTSYFMAQRIKPTSKEDKAEHAEYVDKISLLHQILVLSMKTKQSTQLELCNQLRSNISQFEKAYKAK